MMEWMGGIKSTSPLTKAGKPTQLTTVPVHPGCCHMYLCACMDVGVPLLLTHCTYI